MESITFPKAVFFDWDGTLVDSFAFLHGAHNYVRSEFGMEAFTLDTFAHYFGQPREKLYADIYGADRIEEAKGHFESYVTANHHTIKPIDGAHDVLQAFSDTGIPMGVVTNKKAALVAKEIENHGWADYFVSVVGAGEADSDKPSAAPLLLALERSELGLAPEDIWFIGDTESDLGCAQEAGAPCVFIEDPDIHAGLVEKYKPFLMFNNCRSFADFLLQSDGNGLKREA